jgi:hypothetical protein
MVAGQSPRGPNHGGSEIQAEIHLASRLNLFRQNEPFLESIKKH